MGGDETRMGRFPLLEPGHREPMAFKSQYTSCCAAGEIGPASRGGALGVSSLRWGREGEGPGSSLGSRAAEVWGAVSNSGSSPTSPGQGLQSRYLRPLPNTSLILTPLL